MDPLIPNLRPAPDFCLPDLQKRPHALQEARGRLLILNFWSAECPWSERVDRELLDLLPAWGEGVALWTIAANANEPPELLQGAARQRGLPLLLVDAAQQVAGLYGAQTTPHLFLIDANGLLRYQGAFDDVSFRQRTPSRFYLRQAVKSLLDGQTPEPDFTPPYGCTIVRHF
jgi:peroxiredoxin